MIDYNTYSIITKCSDYIDKEYLPIYEAYFSNLQDEPVRLVYISNKPNRSFVKTMSKIFTDNNFELIVCSEVLYKSTDKRVIYHEVLPEDLVSTYVGKLNAFGRIDIVVNDIDYIHSKQHVLYGIMYKYLSSNGYYIILNTDGNEGSFKLVESIKSTKNELLNIDYVRIYNKGKLTVVKKR